MIGPQFNRHMVRMRFSAPIIGIIRCLLFSLLILVLGINFACSELDMYFPPQDGDWETVTPAEAVGMQWPSRMPWLSLASTIRAGL